MLVIFLVYLVKFNKTSYDRMISIVSKSEEYLKKDPEKKHSEDGYINFSHIVLEIIESDILHLHHDGHIRFKVDNKENLFYVSP